MRCPTCGQEGFGGPAASEQPTPSVQSDMPIPGRDICMMLEKSEKCEEHWKKFLRELPSRNYMSEKQWKYFSVIHNRCLGRWPDRTEIEASRNAAKAGPAVFSDSDVPF